MKKHTIIILLILGVCGMGFAQNLKTSGTPPITNPENVVSVEPELSLEDLRSQLEGTFTVTINKPNYQLLYSKNLLETIKASRRGTELVELNWDDYTIITVLPYSELDLMNSENPKN